MNRITKVIVPFILTVASSLAMAEGGSQRTLDRLNDTSEAKPTLKMLVKEGKVLSIAPADTAGTTGMIQSYRTNSKVQTYEMKVKTPDGEIHTVEFLSAPVGVNNG
ncbi:co-regulatory protein PtrA N-terminal domain-containing protein [Pseudomonas sp.]|uniref:co-regulatory protein PtrA N-terminal domain-containing protein n=1 Tax=Pseudomonas sp. TaxID=306 RepID=UPI003CC61BBE